MRYLTSRVVKNKRVLMRVDFNVGIDDKEEIIDDFRIQRIFPTIKFLKDNKAEKIILISHLGQPEKSDFWTEKFTLRPVADYLEKALKEKIYFCSLKSFKKIREAVEKSEKGAIWLLENIRYHDGEEKNDKDFSRELSQLGDLYINEAFSVSHRKSASFVKITGFLPFYVGFLLKEEIENLDKLIKNPKTPLIIILGGAKIEDKLPLIKRFLEKADYLLIGGALANTILKARGFEIGKSFYESKMLKTAKKFGSNKAELVLPGDFTVRDKDNRVKIRELSRVMKDDKILDIGPATSQVYSQIIKTAKTIFWNGPMGKIEDKRFQEGTKKMIESILSNKEAKTVIGGGDTLLALKTLKPEYRIQNTEYRFFSTGGGAMLKYLAGEKLPGLGPLRP